MTDRRADRHNYDPQDRASIAASRGKTAQEFFLTGASLWTPLPRLSNRLREGREGEGRRREERCTSAKCCDYRDLVVTDETELLSDVLKASDDY